MTVQYITQGFLALVNLSLVKLINPFKKHHVVYMIDKQNLYIVNPILLLYLVKLYSFWFVNIISTGLS